VYFQSSAHCIVIEHISKCGSVDTTESRSQQHFPFDCILEFPLTLYVALSGFHFSATLARPINIIKIKLLFDHLPNNSVQVINTLWTPVIYIRTARLNIGVTKLLGI